VIELHHPAAPAEVERLADIILTLQRCFMLRLSEELSRGKVSFPQFFLLGHLGSQRQALSMSEIAEKMSHSTAAATGLVDRLEKLNYVQRIRAANDRRKVLVKITKKGTALVERIRQDIVNNLSEIMELLPRQEQTAWLSIYEKIDAFCQSKKTACTE